LVSVGAACAQGYSMTLSLGGETFGSSFTVY
jgi:hypothetical protein